MKKILFVDDEANILNGLKRMLHGMRREWSMHFADSGQRALELLAEDGEFDVIVSDIRMPVMDGVELLRRVKEQYPRLTRIILSGHSDYRASLASTRVAHQYLAKPAEAETLKQAIEHDLALKELLNNQALQVLVNDKDALPTPSRLYRDIMREIESPDGSIAVIGELIAQDVSLTAKVLQLVNSAFFGLPRTVDKVAEAVTFLGLDVIRSVVVMTETFSSQQGKNSVIDVDALWHHSMAVADLAKRLAHHEGFARKQQEQAFMAGMLHDIGVLVLGVVAAEKIAPIRAARESGTTIWQAEVDVLGSSHAEIGGYLLGIWGLPNSLVEPVVHHHQPGRHPGHEISVVTIVHVANALVNTPHAQGGEALTERLDMDYLTRIGANDKIEEWSSLAVGEAENG